MNKQNYRRLEGDPVPPDDSWWAAVLAEEEERGILAGHAPTPPKTEGKTGASRPAKQPHIDWEKAREYYEKDQTVCLKVSGYNRGGLLVDGSGLQGFVPLSHLVDLTAEKIESDIADLAPILTPYLGTTLTLKVIECDPERGRIVLSERAALAEPGKRNVLLDRLKAGDSVHGFVTNVTDFGVFVDLGGVEGLIHVSELSWGRVRHPSDVAKVGEEVNAYVIQVNKDRSRVALSLKRLHPNPWETAEERYKPGMVISAVITSVVPFGAFARLEEGLDGLIHVSEMAELGQKANPFNVLREGQEVMVRVLQVNSAKQRLGLSLCPEAME